MNINLRALVFGIVTTAAMTVAFDALGAAEPVQVIRLDGVEVTAHRVNFDDNANLKVVRLDGVVVTAHRALA